MRLGAFETWGLARAFKSADLPDLDALKARFSPVRAPVPQVAVHLPSLGSYDALCAVAPGAPV